MIKFKLMTLFCLISISTYSNANNNYKDTSIKLIALKYNQIEDVILGMHSSYKNLYNWEKSVYVINIKKNNNKYDFRIAIIYKDDFGWILRDKKMKLFGYFEIENNPVLVFGETANKFFSITNELMQLDWFKALPEIRKDKSEIKEPPVIFEPEVWLYQFKKGKFIFYKKGYYSILDL